MMRIFYKPFFLYIGFFAATLIPGYNFAKDVYNNVQCFKHNIQLQLSDSLGFPVDGTQFWVTLDIIKQGNLVTIQFPLINFQTGQVSTEDPTYPAGGLPGGYLYTSDGFLPSDICPNDLVYRSIVAASNNGASLPFSFAQLPSTLPVPPVGYILSVTNAGAVVVQCAGTYGNIIPTGPQILMPADITYITKPRVTLCNNYIIDPGFTNTTQFTGGAASDGIRDSHVNDAFSGVAAWAWASNANQVDKTNGTMDTFVAVGKINADRSLSIGSPINLTNFGPNIQSWDTAVAINRTNPDNIVVSYGVIDRSHTVHTEQTYRAVSFDGGKTWPINGPTNIQPTGTPSAFGDNEGVKSDKFGNIWYGTTNRNDNLGNFIDQPTFWVSTDGGDTYSVAYTAPLPTNIPFEYYDYPQYCFGGDGLGNYGLNFVSDYSLLSTGTYVPAVGFIPITGLGSYGTASFAQLTSLSSVNTVANIAASIDGRIWTQGTAALFSSYITPAGIIFKSPGVITENYAGVWQFIIWNAIGDYWDISPAESQPVLGYFTSPQSIIYDDARQALYAIFSAQYPDYSQNARLYFIISRDNGQTWSDPIDIATTNFANRGFQSMALDPVTGNLVFGWYDGSNDPTYQSVQYFGAILPAGQLDALVNKIPLSNPLYQVPPATGIIG